MTRRRNHAPSPWQQLLAEPDWCRGKGAFPLPAYSEFTPPPWLGQKPYGAGRAGADEGDEHGWTVPEYEQEQELAPGLEFLARNLLDAAVRLGRGRHHSHFAKRLLRKNPYWPADLAAHAGGLAHERYVILTGVALSRTQDDKGRVRWTLFGSSEQGPGKAFWRGFFLAPDEEAPWGQAEAFFAELLCCYGLSEREARDPAAAGVRVLPSGKDGPFRYHDDGPLPSWARELLWLRRDRLAGVRFLLTFRPFALLPADVRNAYLKGELHLWPFPGSLVFWGVQGFVKLARQLPFAMQLPLASLFGRRNDPGGIRIPQAGWLNEKVDPGQGVEGERPMFVRTHRWQKVLRHQDEVVLVATEDRVTPVLFSTDPDDLGLYGKPMARNVQIWTHDYRRVLDGPCQTERAIARAENVLAHGGTFGYRFLYPAMRVGPWQVYWQRPVAAFLGEEPQTTGTVLEHAPTGYLTAYRARGPNLEKPVELWPRFACRPEYLASAELFRNERLPRRWHTTSNVRALLDWHDLRGQAIPSDLARALLNIREDQSAEEWLAGLPDHADDPIAGQALVAHLRTRLARARFNEDDPQSLTFNRTATRPFEEAYWRTIAELAHGRYRNKCTGDCVRDAATRAALTRRRRELGMLARYIVRLHRQAIKEANVPGAWVAEQRLSWRTDFDFPWMGGWLANQRTSGVERNLVVRIPGRDGSRAVILADHYDTAYMHDRYHRSEGGTGVRLAAAGADDNHSATAMLLLAAPILLELSQAGRLACDIWLVHLTGEEFPADCLGSRHLAQALVQGTLTVTEPGGPTHDLSAVRVDGVLVADMIAHNNARNRYVFQISPGEGRVAAGLAELAHEANLAWNALARTLNRQSPRRGCGPYRRSDDPDRLPALAAHAVLRGEIRQEWDPRSTLFNSDGQIFSDVGVPVVLFMEDYDINRTGYHDSHDTMKNIDLDYGAALAAIAIETAARAAVRG